MVLNVGPVHVLTLDGIAGIAKEKAEIVRHLPAGLALLNADDKRVAAMARETSARVTFFGSGPDADVRRGM